MARYGNTGDKGDHQVWGTQEVGVRWLERGGAGTIDLLQDLLQFVVENLGSGL
jgi:hypothetical protein